MATKRSFRQYFYLFSAVYIAVGVICFALNGFDTHKQVERYPVDPHCSSTESMLLEDARVFGCLQTADDKGGGHFTWVSWQFLSNNHGYDTATYLPADLILLVLINAAYEGYIKTKKSR